MVTRYKRDALTQLGTLGFIWLVPSMVGFLVEPSGGTVWAILLLTVLIFRYLPFVLVDALIVRPAFRDRRHFLLIYPTQWIFVLFNVLIYDVISGNGGRNFQGLPWIDIIQLRMVEATGVVIVYGLAGVVMRFIFLDPALGRPSRFSDLL